MKTIKKIIEAAKMKGKDPCWKGYQMVGTKNKNGKEVPNCVPEEVQQEGAVPSGESVITVKHRTSGKTLRISAAAAAKYRAMGYHFHPTNESTEQIEEIYSVKHDGVDANHPDKDVARLFTNKKNVINHVTKFKDSAENRVKLLKDKGFKNVRMEETEQIDELSNATLRGYADKARADIQKTLPKLHTDPKAAGRVEKRISGLAASTVAKVKNNMKSEEVEISEEQHKEISVHTEVEDGSHDDKRDTKDLHDRVRAAAKKHGATITYHDRPSLRGSHTISARGPHEFHKEVKHIASDYEHLGAQHEIDESVEQIDEISADLAGRYMEKIAHDQLKQHGLKSNLYGRLPAKRQAGVDRALERMRVKESVNVKKTTDSDGGVPTEAAQTLATNGQPTQTKNNGQSKMSAYVFEGQMKRLATDKEEDERLAKQKGSWKVETPWKKVKSDVVVDKSGARHTPMSRARDLARKAFSKVHEQSNVQPNPFTVPSSNPGQAPKAKKSRQMSIVREAYKDAKKKKESPTGTADKFIQDPELTSKITKS